MLEKILNNTTPYGKIRASHEGSLHSSTLIHYEVYILYTYTVSRVTYTDEYRACIWTSLGEFRYERYECFIIPILRIYIIYQI